MNWHAIGAVGQIMGSLATFVTVGYLAVQVHDSEIQDRHAIAQNRVERSFQFNLTAATSERIAAVRWKVYKGLYVGPTAASSNSGTPPAFYRAMTKLGLSDDETITLNSERLALWNMIAQTIPYLDELLPVDRAQVDSLNRLSISDPIFRLWYRFTKSNLNADAVRYVDELMAQSGYDDVAVPDNQAEGTR